MARTSLGGSRDRLDRAGNWDFASLPRSPEAMNRAPPRNFDRLPALPVDDLVEQAPVRTADRPQRPVGRVAERDQQRANSVVREAEDAPRQVLVLDGRVPTADAEVGSSEHDAHRGLP